MEHDMQILSLDVGGKFAHFRKYFGNNSALSYSIPPRTAIMGMLAAILGRPRDSYYEELSSENIKIGIRVISPIKKSFHRLNFLSIKTADDFSGKGGRIQTPFEVITGYNIATDWVLYRLFISPYLTGSSTFDELCSKLIDKNLKYNLSLGTANFSASIFNFKVHTDIEKKLSETLIPIHSAVVSETVRQLEFGLSLESRSSSLEEELLPADFKGNQNRELKKIIRTLFSANHLPFDVKLNVPYYEIRSAEETQNIVFLE